ncbi:hypothetical protein LXL04_033170 [Taraxacum kok-saghyz]
MAANTGSTPSLHLIDSVVFVFAEEGNIQFPDLKKETYDLSSSFPSVIFGSRSLWRKVVVKHAATVVAVDLSMQVVVSSGDASRVAWVRGSGPTNMVTTVMVVVSTSGDFLWPVVSGSEDVNYNHYERFGGSRSRFFENNNGLGDIGNWGSSRSRSFENSYIPENPRTPKPLTFSKNRLRWAKNRSNTSPVAKIFFRKNIFFLIFV